MELLLAGLLRLVPHPPNFAPVGALALYGGARLSGWSSWAVPLSVLAVGDLLLQLVFGIPFLTPTTFSVFLGFGVYILLGRSLRGCLHPFRIGSTALLGSLQFYLITNFSVWYFSGMYTPDLSGLLSCYGAGIPFFALTASGDLFFTGTLFFAHHLVLRRKEGFSLSGG